jgi:hypothetical protein
MTRCVIAVTDLKSGDFVQCLNTKRWSLGS